MIFLFLVMISRVMILLHASGCRAKHPDYFGPSLPDGSQWISAGIGE